MSKAIKQMEMTTLRNTFKEVRDLVVLSVQGLSSHGEYTFRASLRKKKIRVQMVKNTLTRKVFSELGMSVSPDSPYWQKPTALVWGAGSIAELSREIKGELAHPKNGPLYKTKDGKPFVQIKGAIADGQAVTFEQAIAMPTRPEAIARVAMLALAPAGRLLSQLRGPGGTLVGQIKSMKDKEETPARGESGEAPPPA